MILFIDSYDSFTNNLVRLIETTTGKHVVTVHNDSVPVEEYDEFFQLVLPQVEYIVIGPGPGHPANSEDAGIIPALFEHLEQSPVPVLGICLGFQSLCLAYGNEVEKLPTAIHGQIYDVIPCVENSLITKATSSVRYHSLHVRLALLSKDLVPLAYCEESGEKILMAVKHDSFPYYGVQYHPESICSDGGVELVANFDRIADDYNRSYPSIGGGVSIDRWARAHGATVRPLAGPTATPVAPPVVPFARKFRTDATPLEVCDYILGRGDNCIFLNLAAVPGDWSIIGVPTVGKSAVLTHSVDKDNEIVVLVFGTHQSQLVALGPDKSVWTYLAAEMRAKSVDRSDLDKHVDHSRPFPFWGGYLGLFSYEEGRHIVVPTESFCSGPTPDTKLVFVDLFVLYDHTTSDFFIVGNEEWTSQLASELESAAAAGTLQIDPGTVPALVRQLCQDPIECFLPDRKVYGDQFDRCQAALRAGDSYELCLTAPLKIVVPAQVRPWDIYKVLTLHKNPSPYSCFMAFDDVVLISSSPERFLSWKNGEKGKKVELRPIKGTVKNTAEMDRETAAKILKTPKEMGENLMIVDLIRHDLYQFIDHVEVSQLMAVEEYKTVFQLVSVIGGELAGGKYTGLDILCNSLPPGSMTGAPKKRSVELLQPIESLQPLSSGRRGIYSGVVGYWSITDEADWSVIIRSVYSYTNDREATTDKRVWRIGAGGAITVLSEEEAEWQEMLVKLTSALQAFQ